MGTNTNKSKLQTQAEDIAQNLPNVLPATAKMPYGGTSLTPAQIVAEIQADLSTFADAANAKLTYTNAVSKKKTAVADLHSLVTAVVAYLKVMIPTDHAGLASCGIEPKKAKVQLTSAEKAALAAQRKATRAANGVQGAQQKRKAALAAKATTIVLGPDGKPLDGSPMPAPAALTAAK
jgi:hypothetical protein